MWTEQTGAGGVKTGAIGVLTSAVWLADEMGVGAQDAMSAFVAGLDTQCLVSLTSEVPVGGLQAGCGGVTRPLDERGVGNGGLLGPFGRPLALGLASESGGRALPVWGANSPASEATAGSVDVGASRGDARAFAEPAIGEGAGWGFAMGGGVRSMPWSARSRCVWRARWGGVCRSCGEPFRLRSRRQRVRLWWVRRGVTRVRVWGSPLARVQGMGARSILSGVRLGWVW